MSDTEGPSPDKREAILAEAIQVFAQEGFRGTDVQTIADRAGVGKGTVYRYFGNKEDLFYATSLETTRRKELAIVEAMEPAGRPIDKLRAAARAIARFFEANPLYIELLVQERAEFRGHVPEAHRDYFEHLIDKFGKIIRASIDAGEIRPVDVRKTILTISAMLHGIALDTCYRMCDCSLVEMSESAMEMFLRGIQTERNS